MDIIKLIIRIILLPITLPLKILGFLGFLGDIFDL